MMRRPCLLRDRTGTAAAEMALVLPLLLVLLCSAVEAANYFYNEHILVQAVRDAARFAARQDAANFTECTGSPGGSVVTDTTNMLKNGLLTGGNTRIPWTGATISITTACTTTAGGQTMGGVFNAMTNSSGGSVGAPVVTVSASVPYTPLLQAFGFSGIGLKLNASQQAAVAGW
jgi:Flp pilus assembly protein TadG